MSDIEVSIVEQNTNVQLSSEEIVDVQIISEEGINVSLSPEEIIDVQFSPEERVEIKLSPSEEINIFLDEGVGIDMGMLLKLFDEDFQFSYNPDGTISQIVIDTKGADGNPKTVTLTFSYDDEGNLTKIEKRVS